MTTKWLERNVAHEQAGEPVEPVEPIAVILTPNLRKITPLVTILN